MYTGSASTIPAITKNDIEQALTRMNIGKDAGEDGTTVDLLKEGGDNALKKLAALFSQCLKS